MLGEYAARHARKVNESCRAAVLPLTYYMLSHQSHEFMKRPDGELPRVCYQIIVETKMSLYVNMSLDQGYMYMSFYLLIDFILFIKVAFPA